MKTITIDYETYMKEMTDAHREGYRRSARDLQEIIEAIKSKGEYCNCFKLFDLSAFEFMPLRDNILIINALLGHKPPLGET